VLASGEFELKESNEIVASGQIRASNTVEKELLNLFPSKTKSGKFLPLKSADIYKELRLKGYDYKEPYRGIKLIDNIGNN
jgi:fatty acid synthase